ncbi:MAG: alpha/beta fold hydrolase, partial [Clostridia bacterium]|nr:alpha/beta fold hydrolase [Clostridia bacterium]
MEYAAFGHGSRVCAVLPGLSDGLATVRGKALLLAGPYRPYFGGWTVYMFSRREDLPEGYRIRDMASDQAEALQALGVEKACVLGVSQGGMIAQTLAADWPDLVEKLVVAVSAPFANETVQARLADWIRFAEAGDHYHLM